jgi:hypothetical protein
VKVYREPTEIERAFLRIVSRGYNEIEQQIESCRIADYDPTGWCDVEVTEGPPSPIRYHAQGPAVRTGPAEQPTLYLESVLAVSTEGFLESIEIVRYVGDVESPYSIFVEAARHGELLYGS